MPLPQHPRDRRTVDVAGIVAGLVGGTVLAVIAVASWQLLQPVDLVEGIRTGGTTVQPERYCCGTLAWRANLAAVLLTSAIVGLAALLIGRLPRLRGPLAPWLLAAGVVIGSLVIVADVAIGVGSGLPDAPAVRRDWVVAWLSWLVLPIAAIAVPHRITTAERAADPVPDPEPAGPT